jgi:hypothetical protein
MLGCGASERPPQRQSACVDGLRWHGRTYVPITAYGALPPTLRASPVHFPGCRDASGAQDTGRTVTLLELEGVPTSVVFGANDPPRLYFTRDSLPGLKGHPLHRLLPAPPAPRTTSRCKEETLIGQMGMVTLDPVFGIEVDGHAERLRLTPDTRLLAPAVDGVPRIHAGDRVTVRAIACPRRVTKLARELRVN